MINKDHNYYRGIHKIATKSASLFSTGECLASIFWPIIRLLDSKNVAGRVPRPSKKSFRGGLHERF